MSNSESTAAAGARPIFGDRGYSTQTASSLFEGRRPTWLAIALAVLSLAYGPLLWMFFDQQWQKPHYQFFPYVIGAFCWLLWSRWRESMPITGQMASKTSLVRVLQVAAVLLLAFGLAIRSPWSAMVSLNVLVAAWFVRISERRHVVNLWGIWILLWLVVPPPRNFDQTLITRLQFVSSRLSSYVLDGFGIEHLMDGNTLWLNAKQLFVDEACSGIISMLSIAACAVIFCVVKNRSPLHLVLLTVSSIAWATLINVFRISLIAFVLEKWGIDWSAGLPHETLSLVLFLLAFGALLCTDQVLIACLSPIRSVWNESQGSKIRLGNRLVSFWDRLVRLGLPSANAGDDNPEPAVAPAPAARGEFRRWIVPAIFAPVAVLQATLLVSAFQRSADRLPAVQTATHFGAENMPQVFCGLHRTDFRPFQRGANNINGKYSRTFSYSGDDGSIYMLSFDFPFPGYWHELTECYVAAGWHPLQRELLSNDSSKSDSASWRYVEARFAKSSGEHGCLCFSEFDQFGVPYDPQSDWHNDRNSFWRSRNLYLKERQVFQVQVWSEGPTEWTPQQQEKAHELLLAARANIRAQIVGSISPDEPLKADGEAATESKHSSSLPANKNDAAPAAAAPPTEGSR